jgi:hypothetical protein
MTAFVDFVESVIYGTGLAPNPNDQDWLALGLTGGTDWLQHHLDRMLPAYETWLSSEGLPPVTPWDGVRPVPWDPAQDLPLGAALDGSFTGVATLNALGLALRTRYTLVAGTADELAGLLKAPFSYRFWSYLKWAWTMRERFEGRQVFPTGILYDRDGTILSATPFCDAFNDLHRNWHIGAVASGVATPGFRTTAGQRSLAGILGAPLRGEEFLRFHREHLDLFHRWLDRTRQPHLRPIDMGRPGGWPPPPAAPVVNPPAPWASNEAAVTPAAGLATQTSVNQVGAIEGGYHVAGHGQNTDIGPLSHNNYVSRFHNWHGWIDAQWWWREPRFAQSDPLSGARTRIFRPILQTGADLPGLFVLSIVRDPLAAADSLYPADAVGAIDFTTGNGTLRIKLAVRDPFGRNLRLRLTAEVFDGAGALVPGLTVQLLRTIGAGGDHPLDTEFTEDLALSGAFVSDDPTHANPAVGFINSRIAITGQLWVPGPAAPNDPTQSPDAGFVHEDRTTIDLVREKLAPEALIYQDLSSFSEDQVTSAMSGAQATFENAFYLIVQDRTTAAFPLPAWPALVADEVKGLIVGEQAASGLFDDLAHQPEVVLWQELVDAPINGVSVQLLGTPDKEDPTLPPDIAQRLTWRYAIVFDQVNNAFTGLAAGGQRTARLRATVRDRAGNSATAQATVKLFKDANPFMIDGPTSWLSVDTRTFALMDGQARLNETLAAGAPLTYLNAILTRLNNGTTGVETFDDLAQAGLGAALEYAQAIPNPSTGTMTPIYNFALAKVRLQGAAGAANVRAFFRLFRYAAPSLLFSTTAGYRAYDNGAGTIVPRLGFESETAGAALTSIPFFATTRINNTTAAMDTQFDAPNVHTFPPGPTNERVWYFGAWLDINDPNARMPALYNAAGPDGPYTPVALQSLRTLMHDFHQCMVVEIRYDGDPTEPLAAPASSDNLAQRNLVILHSDNPGDSAARTLEHSFEIDLARPRQQVEIPHPDEEDHHRHAAVVLHHDHEHPGHGGAVCPVCGHDELDTDFCCACCGGLGMEGPLAADAPRRAASTFTFQRLVHDEAMSLAMQSEEGGRLMAQGDHMAILELFGARAAEKLRRAYPFVFHPTRWSQTAAAMDELMIRWNDLPRTAEARLFVPGQSAEEIVSLRNLRHAPATVHSEGQSMLRLDVEDVTYIPIPPLAGDRQAAVLTVALPEGVKAGQRFAVDVIQLRAGSTVENGGFRMEIQVGKAVEFFATVERGVALLHEQLSLVPAGDRWQPILAQRLRTERRRARALADRLGIAWQDPTVWTNAQGAPQPIRGMKIRVVLEQIQILDDRDPWLKGAGEIDFDILVRTENNGGVEQRTRLPHQGHYHIASGQIVPINQEVFAGFAEDNLALRINAMERDDPDDNLGSYVRTFSCSVASWLGQYQPGDEVVDPETVGYWQVWYRIERA